MISALYCKISPVVMGTEGGLSATATGFQLALEFRWPFALLMGWFYNLLAETDLMLTKKNSGASICGFLQTSGVKTAMPKSNRTT